MEEKNQYKMLDISEKCTYDLFEKVVNFKFKMTPPVELNENMMLNSAMFLENYNDKYIKLKKIVWKSDRHIKTFTFTDDKTEQQLRSMNQYLARVKRTVMEPAFERLGPQVIEASRSASQLVDLMYQKRVKNEEFHQIVAGLARWHVLDDLQRQLQPHDFASCFAGFGSESHAGHPVGNIYDQADKGRLRDTLEALYHEKYSMTVTHGWTVSKERTKQFLFAFVLSLYKNSLGKLYGKMAAFQRFFTEVCGYTFIKAAETYQKWYRDYQSFLKERTQRTANLPKNESEKAYKAWKRKVKKYLPLEELTGWICERLPQYRVSLA